jgi:hypothetical protein
LFDATPRCVIDAIAWQRQPPRHVEASLIEKPLG